MKRSTIVLTTAVVLLALLGATLATVAYTGAVDVAATSDYLPGAEWFFATLSRESIRHRAAAAVEAGELTPLAQVDDTALRTGATHYREMCVVCHGAPGAERGELGQGLKPQPPDLAHTAREWSDAEILWTVKHGIRHTGMPSFGATHSDDELGAIAAFVARLDGMSPEEYRRLVGGPGPAAGGDPSGGPREEAGHGHSGHEH